MKAAWRKSKEEMTAMAWRQARKKKKPEEEEAWHQ